MDKAWDLFHSNFIKSTGETKSLFELYEEIYKPLSDSIVTRVRNLGLSISGILSKWLLISENTNDIEQIKYDIQDTLQEIKRIHIVYKEYYILGRNISSTLGALNAYWIGTITSHNQIYPEFCQRKITKNLGVLQKINLIVEDLYISVSDNPLDKNEVTTKIIFLNNEFHKFFHGRKNSAFNDTFTYIQGECLEVLSHIEILSTNIMEDFKGLISNVEFITRPLQYSTELERLQKHSHYLQNLRQGYVQHGNISLQQFMESYKNEEVVKMIYHDTGNIVHSIQEELVISSFVAIQHLLRYISTNGKQKSLVSEL